MQHLYIVFYMTYDRHECAARDIRIVYPECREIWTVGDFLVDPLRYVVYIAPSYMQLLKDVWPAVEEVAHPMVVAEMIQHQSPQLDDRVSENPLDPLVLGRRQVLRHIHRSLQPQGVDVTVVCETLADKVHEEGRLHDTLDADVERGQLLELVDGLGEMKTEVPLAVEAGHVQDHLGDGRFTSWWEVAEVGDGLCRDVLVGDDESRREAAAHSADVGLTVVCFSQPDEGFFEIFQISGDWEKVGLLL